MIVESLDLWEGDTTSQLGADSPKPKVPFGSLASADTLMRSGEHPDRPVKSGGVTCPV